MNDPLTAARLNVARIMNRLYACGLTTTSGGNISLRHDARTIVLTPAAADKGDLQPADIAVMDTDGRNRTPQLKPSSETSMHLAILRDHSHVTAVVHAHPPAATSFAVSRRPLDTRIVSEAYAILGTPVVAPYTCTGTPELAQTVSACIGPETSCILLANHGVVTLGASLLQAFDRLEVLEQVARINLYAAVLGDTVILDELQCRELDALMGREGKH